MKNLFLLFLICFLSSTINAQWVQKGSDIDGESAEDRSGSSVSISGDGLTVAIGARLNDGGGVDTNSGHVRVYKFISGTWTKQGGDIDGEFANDLSGSAVSLSGDGLTVAIGAPASSDAGFHKGHVRVFKLISGVWSQQGADIDGEAENDWSGGSISLSDDGLWVAIGAPQNDDAGQDAGHVRVFKLVSGVWNQQGNDIDGVGVGDGLGVRVCISDDGLTIVTSAEAGWDPLNQGSGYVRVYKLISNVWTQQGDDIIGENNFDLFGRSLSISADGNTIAAGSIYNSDFAPAAGHVRVYKLISGVWTQQGADIDGEAENDWSGSSISLSADGLGVAIGAAGNDGTAPNAGHVRVFKLVSGVWTKRGVDIDGEAAEDHSGVAVSLSDDGLTVAIGADLNNGSGSKAGHVRVYSQSIVSVKENVFNSNVRIFPNPFTSVVNIDFGELKDVSIKVYSAYGDLVYQEETASKVPHQFKIKTAPGLYFIMLESQGEKRQFKIMKE